MRAELSRLVTAGVIEPVDGPTSWVSQMAVVVKPNGKLRICIDPRGLNTALMRVNITSCQPWTQCFTKSKGQKFSLN